MCTADDPAGINHWTSGPLLAGPMVGEVGTTDAFIWVQARDGSKLTISVKPETSGEVTEFTLTPAAADGFCVTFHVTGLAPATRYLYFFTSTTNGTTYPEAKLFQTAPPNSARKAVIAFGSCFKFYGQAGESAAQAAARDAIFHSIAYKKPDVLVMAGDTCYYGDDDRASVWTMLCAQLRNRNNDAIREVLPFVSTLGVWDDHDYGPDNSDKDYAHKDTRSRPTFKRMWAQRSWGEQEKGIYSSVRWGPAEIFLLDGRYFRDKTAPGKTVLGTQQLDWLKQKLLASDAAVKVLVSTTVLLPEFIGKIQDPAWEGWQVDGKEDRENVLLPFIEQHDIKGVIFISGDLHLGYLYRRQPTVLPGDKIGPTYWEVVSSPLANKPWDADGVVMDSSPFYDRGVLVEVFRPNYGLIDIDLDRAGAEVKLSVQQHEAESGLVHSAFTQSVPISTLRKRALYDRLSAVAWPSGKAYFFRGDRYTRYSITKVGEVQHADEGYPQKIGDKWPGLPSDFHRNIDAGYAFNGKAYLFKGNGYFRYTADPLHWASSPPSWTPDSGSYPRYIKLNWPKLWDWDWDAVVPWTNGFVYFFRGKEYLRCSLGQHEADGEPKPILGNWPGLGEVFPDGIDAGVVWTDGKAYFFKGDQFVRYNVEPKSIDGGVKSIATWWPDLVSL